MADIFVNKCHESSAKVNLGLGGGICPYWQYIENLWHDIQILKERLFWRPLQHAHLHNQHSQYIINCRLTSLEMNWLFIKNADHDSFCWAFDIVDLLKWDYCLHNEMLMFFCVFSLTDPQSLRNWRILLFRNITFCESKRNQKM